jgi:hypothetical protein
MCERDAQEFAFGKLARQQAAAAKLDTFIV